jgi:fumarate reductase flavoprotein subunit
VKKNSLLLLVPLLLLVLLLPGMALAGCISQSSRSSGSIAVSNIRPVGTYNADVCVVGAGISGLSATVQALQNDLSVVVLEKSGSTGGGGRGTEGVFGVGSQMQ